MAKGIFLLKNKNNGESQLISKFIYPDSKNDVEKLISTEIINRISVKHGIFGDSSNVRDIISYRVDGVKFYSIYIVKDEELKESVFIVFILGLKESVEPFAVLLDEMRDNIKSSLKTSDSNLMENLKQILKEREDLVELVGDKEKIQKKISAQANKMLDEGEFQRAQELIKIAKELPPKIADLVKKADTAFSEKNYRSAEKAYKDAADLAKKINETSMSELLQKRANRSEEIPKFNKTWTQLYDEIIKPLKKLEKREHGFYQEPVFYVNKAQDISDMLEDDETINDLQRLDDLLQRGSELSIELDNIDDEIKLLIEKLKK